MTIFSSVMENFCAQIFLLWSQAQFGLANSRLSIRKETLFWWKFLLLEFSRCIRSICRSVSLYIVPSVEKTFRYCSQLTASCTRITRWGCDGNWGMGLWILVSTVAEPLPVSFSKFPCKLFHWSLKIKVFALSKSS